MSKLDFSDPEIKSSIDGVKNNGNQWVLFTHVGTTNKIKVVEKGDGFGNLIDEFSDGKVMYAYCRMKINEEQTKFLFVTWCGDGVNDMVFKGKFANYCKDFEFYMKGSFHSQVNARRSDDLDEAEIIKKLKLSTGAAYTQQNVKVKDFDVQQSKQNIVEAPNKQTVQKQSVSIDKEKQNEFWKKQNDDLDKQRKEKELQVDAQRSQRVAVLKDANKPAPPAPAPTPAPKPALESKPVVNSNEKASNIRAKFEQMANKPAPEPVQKPAPAKLHSTFGAKQAAPAAPVATPAPPAAKPSIEAPPAKVAPKAPIAIVQDPPAPEPVAEPEPEPVAEPVAEPEPEPTPEPEPVAEPVAEPEAAPEPVAEPEQAPEEPAAAAEEYPLAVALYDFDAGDAEELTIREGEQLRIIQQASDWWTAENAEGKRGFIPGNYVQMQ